MTILFLVACAALAIGGFVVIVDELLEILDKSI